MSRLVHAAARGARLQVFADNCWYGITQIYMPFRRDARAIRIHPDDAHLQYGPISTALREMALTGDCEDYVAPYIAFEIEKETGYWPSTLEQRCVFMLILAEALADEGL